MKPLDIGQRSATHGSVKPLTRRSPDASAVHWAALTAAVFASLSLLGWVLLNCRSGFDFTDEGFYLNWISNPWNYPASLSQFGFVYHPLYVLVGGDVVRLRQANVLILFGLAWLLCGALFSSMRGQEVVAGSSSRAGFACSAMVAASSVFLFLQVWLPTPNYNSLTLQSMMLAVTGGLLAGRGSLPRSMAGWLMIGIGGGLAFLAKPPSAAILGLLMAIYLAMAKRLRFSGVLISVVAAGLLVAAAAFAIDGSLSGFFTRIVKGLDLSNRLLAFSNTTERLFSPGHYILDSRQLVRVVGFIFVVFVTTGLGYSASRFARPISVILTLMIAATSVIALAGFSSPKLVLETMQTSQIMAVVLGAMWAELLASKTPLRVPSQSNLAIVGLLLLLPCAFAFGTGSGFWQTAGHAALFWLLAGLVVYIGQSPANAAWQKLLPVTALALVMSAGALFVATGAPYRQTEPLNQQRSVIDLPPGRSQLFVSEQVANYIRTLRRLAVTNGFRDGDALLDLTGESPGSQYAIGARPLAASWALGGYPGSEDFVTTALDAEPCKAIAVSWLLDDPGGGNSIPAGVLVGQGADLSADYTVVGSVHGTRGFAPSNFEYRLLRPTRSPEAAEASCKAARHR